MPQTKGVVIGRWTGGGCLRPIAGQVQVPRRARRVSGGRREPHGGYLDRLQAEVQLVSATSLFQAELRACQAGLAETLASPSAGRSTQAKGKPPTFSAQSPWPGRPAPRGVFPVHLYPMLPLQVRAGGRWAAPVARKHPPPPARTGTAEGRGEVHSPPPHNLLSSLCPAGHRFKRRQHLAARCRPSLAQGSSPRGTVGTEHQWPRHHG